MPDDRADDRTAITVMGYDKSAVVREEVATMAEALDRIGLREVTWIVVRGPVDEKGLDALRERLDLHPVVVDEIAEHLPVRPKLVDFQDYIFITWRLLRLEGQEVAEGQTINLLGKDFLFTVVPAGHRFPRTMDALGNEHNQVRSLGADYLLYDIIDTVIDDYFSISEELGELIEDAQDRVLNNGGSEALTEIQRLRRVLMKVRKAIWPMREAINVLVKGQSDLVDDYTAPYYRDAYDHTIELMDTVDTHRDMLSEMLDIYQTNVSNQLNKIVKVLTLISVIFAPLTFIVGLYGMNFQAMPELGHPLGYPMVLISMLFIALAMVWLFRRRGWY
ncbi:MAG: magnesium/cobalt transporter CorA [Methanomassiliicoccus sp.]|nr:magnesium/cobalt transporter CorA [Methanomassiliicoccus sp.]